MEYILKYFIAFLFVGSVTVLIGHLTMESHFDASFSEKKAMAILAFKKLVIPVTVFIWLWMLVYDLSNLAGLSL